jgi:hypothetical protein
MARSERCNVSMYGVVWLGDGRQFAVELTDLSAEGCKVTTAETLIIGTTVNLVIEGFDEVPASVRWALNGIAGLRFEQPLGSR